MNLATRISRIEQSSIPSDPTRSAVGVDMPTPNTIRELDVQLPEGRQVRSVEDEGGMLADWLNYGDVYMGPVKTVEVPQDESR